MGELFEKFTGIENNDFVEKSLSVMFERYKLNYRSFCNGLECLMFSIDKLKTYDDVMRFLAGIYKNNTNGSRLIKKVK